MKKFVCAILGVMILFCNVNAFAANYSSWAENEINEAEGLGLIPEGLFENYNVNITRKDFAHLAVNFVALEYNLSISDMMNVYCSTYKDENENPIIQEGPVFSDCDDYYINCAYTLGIVKGYGDNKFAPNQYITREEAAKMLTNTFFTFAGGIKHGQKSVLFEQFEDYNEISSWAESDACYMWEWGVMNGTSDKTFSPKDNYTVEQCIATFLRLYNNAPISRAHGDIICPVSYEEFLNDILADTTEYNILFSEENEKYRLLYIERLGLPHGAVRNFWVIYKNGGRKNISELFENNSLGYTLSKAQNFVLNSEKDILSFDIVTDGSSKSFIIDILKAKLID